VRNVSWDRWISKSARRVARSSLLLAAVGTWRVAPAHAQWALEGFLGTSISAHSPLTIRQAGYPTLKFTADYATRPTDPSIYYAVRLSRWWTRWGGVAGYVHQKIYLTNNPPEVQSFKVTYGYNLVGVGAGYLTHGWAFIGTIGPVVSNPASTIRGLEFQHEGGIFGTGNHVGGFNLQVGANRRFRFAGWGFATADLRLSAAWTEVPVADGSADTPNYAVHFLLGLGVGKRRPPGAPAP